MYIVKGLYIKTGREICILACDTAEEALSRIIRCYKNDERLAQLGEYYYFWTKY